MSPELKKEITNFIETMDVDLDQTKEMIRTEDNLVKAIQEYEKAWKVKIKMEQHDRSE